ncbi:TlpA family protein disulfide reductase [uncultured Croceitalea sp.]|uniref:TlpA family protein disulfide reductase n=1 Tax=uncultured Croceitalea sp. TaxID=1798908 RepID=UPI00374FD8C3
MNFKKGQVSDIIWIVLILLFLFTPIGFHARVQLMRLFSFAPNIENQESYEKLSNLNWELTSLDGEEYNLITSENNVIVINYWATWCPPCVAEMPSLMALHDDYGSKVKFIFLAKDDKEKVKSYLAKNNYEIPVLFEKTKSPKGLESSSLPTTYILDKRGNIILKEIGAADWNSKKVRELLDNLLLES